jgi:hypothetical protein
MKEQAGNKFRFLANLGQAECGSCLAGVGAGSGWFSTSRKPGAIALRLDSDQETEGYCLLSSRTWRWARFIGFLRREEIFGLIFREYLLFGL